MKKWNYFVIAAGILAGTTIYNLAFSDAADSEDAAMTSSPNGNSLSGKSGSMENFIKPSKQELRQRLSKLQYEVTQNEATERPYKNEYWDNKKPGIYVDVVSGEALFSSNDKFKSGTGWPSFTRPIKANALMTRTDRKLFYTRTELRSRFAGSHLGHVFEDGPAPTGLRYCINSAALRFIPKDDLVSQGYKEFVSLFEQ